MGLGLTPSPVFVGLALPAWPARCSGVLPSTNGRDSGSRRHRSATKAWDSGSGGRSPAVRTRALRALANAWDSGAAFAGLGLTPQRRPAESMGLRLARGRFAAERAGLGLAVDLSTAHRRAGAPPASRGRRRAPRRRAAASPAPAPAPPPCPAPGRPAAAHGPRRSPWSAPSCPIRTPVARVARDALARAGTGPVAAAYGAGVGVHPDVCCGLPGATPTAPVADSAPDLRDRVHRGPGRADRRRGPGQPRRRSRGKATITTASTHQREAIVPSPMAYPGRR